jgi:hypothetical protein
MSITTLILPALMVPAVRDAQMASGDSVLPSGNDSGRYLAVMLIVGFPLDE